jgi:hypothetical protein
MKIRFTAVSRATSAAAGAAVLAAGLLIATGQDAFAAPAASASPAAAAASSESPNPWIARSGLPAAAAKRLQAEIDRQLAAHGGTQISPYEVAYAGGDVVMVFADPVTGALPTDSDSRAEAGRQTAPGRPGAAAGLAPLTTSYRYGCPYNATAGWTCFYQNIDFNHNTCGGGGACGDGGRMLEFASCGTADLSAYGFSDQTTSWVNNTSSYVTVYDANSTLLWSESPGSSSSYVGSADNDRADNFWLIC